MSTTASVAQLAEGNRVHASFVLPNGRVLITNGNTGTTTLANGSTGAIEATIPVGTNPDAAIYDPVSDRVFVMNANSGDISVIDTTLGKEDARIAVGGKLEAAAVDGKGLLFVNIEDAAKVAVIDTRTREVERRFDLKGCEEPSAIAFIAAGRLLVSTCANEVAKVIGADDGHEVMDIPIGPHPDSALVDTNRGRVFIATAGSAAKNGEITVLDIGGSPAVDRGRADTRRNAVHARLPRIRRPVACTYRPRLMSSAPTASRTPSTVRSRCSSSRRKERSSNANRFVGWTIEDRTGGGARSLGEPRDRRELFEFEQRLSELAEEVDVAAHVAASAAEAPPRARTVAS